MRLYMNKRVEVNMTEGEEQTQRRVITEQILDEFQVALYQEEKSGATRKKYLCDLKKLAEYLNGREVSKENLIQYKEYLEKSGKYQISSINSFLVAANRFCQWIGWNDAVVKTVRLQKEVFCPEEKYLTMEEYKRLIKTAQNSGKKRIGLIIQTIGSTGIRISELQYITVETLQTGIIEIHCKGKVRKILLPGKLCKILKRYVRERRITTGAVFQTSTGKPMDRSNIWREMKSLCDQAGVDQEKVFPHNLRHLFARCFYRVKKDIAKLADVLGHSNMETTRIYMKSTGMEHQRQLDAMNMVVTT